MVDFLDLFTGGDDNESKLLELRLGTKPLNVLFFTSTGDWVSLHFEDDPTVNTFLICPGPKCPCCALDERPSKVLLLPAYDIAKAKVGVIRVSDARGPRTLGTQLSRILARTDIADIVVNIQRERNDYKVTARKFNEHADRGAEAISRFIAEKPPLASAFQAMSPEEMREIPRLRNILNTIDMGTDSSATPPPSI